MGLDLGEMSALPRGTSVAGAIDWLCRRHGGAKAHRLVRQEQRKARRARSRKRFEFWAAVAAQMEAGDCGVAAPGDESEV